MSEHRKRLKTAQELLDIAEFQFIRRLKKKNPNISDSEIQLSVRNWYKKQPKPGNLGVETCFKKLINEQP